MGKMANEVDAAHSTPADSVLVTAKRLDSDEVEETVTEVEPTASEAAVRDLLSGLVRAAYPDAEFRSFANGAATFLAPKLLIVAVHCPASGGTTEAAGEDDRDSQQQLFAA